MIGVVAGGEARAYPVNLMWKPENEVLNDTLGGRAVAATWCPIAHSAVVYDRAAEGVELGAIGLEKGVFILYDRPSGSWWSQVTGRAVRGPGMGRSLPKRPSTLTTWGLWRRLHPGTTVFVDPSLPGRRRFTEESLSRITPAGGGPVDNEDLVVAVEGASSARAYLLRRLARERLVHDAVDPGLQPLRVRCAPHRARPPRQRGPAHAQAAPVGRPGHEGDERARGGDVPARVLPGRLGDPGLRAQATANGTFLRQSLE